MNTFEQNNINNINDRMYTEELYALEHDFYKLPRFLFKDNDYKKISNDSKIMYAILRDRQDLSIKNKWFDENGYIYFLYTNSELSKILELSEPVIIKCKKELLQIGLLFKKRMGRGLPDKLYILRPKLERILEKRKENKYRRLKTLKFTRTKKSLVLELKNLKPRTKESLVLELKNLKPIYTDNSQTNSINTHSFIQEEISDRTNEKYKEYKRILYTNLDYDLIVNGGSKILIKELDEIVEFMLDIIITSSEKIKISNSYIPKKLVVERFLKLKYEHIEFVLKMIRENQTKITNYSAYLTTCLYNSYTLYNIHVANEIRYING